MTNDDAWKALLAHAASKPAFSWMANLEPRRWEQQTVFVGIRAGTANARDVLKFITPARREQMGQFLSNLMSKPIRLELDAGSPSTGDYEDAGPTGVGAGASGPVREVPGRPVSQIQQAMALPLVKQVMEIFETRVLDFRADDQEPEPLSPSGPKVDAHGSDDDSPDQPIDTGEE